MAWHRLLNVVPAFALACLTAALQNADARLWRDSSGRYSVEADIVTVEGDTVRLKRADGKIIRVSIRRLSQEDQSFIIAWQEPETSAASIPSQPAEASASRPEMAGAGEVDEELFLFHLLQYLHGRLVPSDPDSWETELRDVKQRAMLARERAVVVDKDGKIVGLYDDYISLISAVVVLPGEIDYLANRKDRQVASDSVDALGPGAVAGVGTYQTLTNGFEVESSEALAAGIALGVLTSAVDAWSSQGQREDDVQRDVDQMFAELEQAELAFLTRAASVGEEYAQTRGWRSGEAGFKVDPELFARMQRLDATEDFEGLERLMGVVEATKPRDPFVRLARCNCSVLKSDATSASVFADAKRCEAATALIPPSPLYDDYRITCLEDALEYAIFARRLERLSGDTPIGSTPTSQYAVEVARRTLSLDPLDGAGAVRLQLAEALLANNEVDAAREEIRRLPEGSQAYYDVCYLMAAILSRQGDAKRSLPWLEAAIRNGMWNRSLLAADPDFNHVRQAAAKEYAELIRPKWHYDVSEGWFTDDVVLTNTSLFPLTNIDLRLVLTGEDGQTVTCKLNTEMLMPGKTYTWDDAMTAKSGDWKVNKAVLVTDETD